MISEIQRSYRQVRDVTVVATFVKNVVRYEMLTMT